MIKTKYVKLLCVSLFLVSALTGCGKKPPTAEELLSQSFAETEYSYVNAKIDSALNVTLNISEALGSDNDNILSTLLEFLDLESYVLDSYTPELGSLFVPTSVISSTNVGIEILADNSIHAFTTTDRSSQEITFSINNIESGSNYTLQYDLEHLASSGAYCVIGKLVNNMDNIRRDVGQYNGETLTFTANSTTLDITFNVTGAHETSGDILIKNIMLTKN